MVAANWPEIVTSAETDRVQRGIEFPPVGFKSTRASDGDPGRIKVAITSKPSTNLFKIITSIWRDVSKPARLPVWSGDFPVISKAATGA